MNDKIMYGISQEKYDQLKAETDKIKLPAVFNGTEWVAIDADVIRCSCGGWSYIGSPCAFCGKESKQ